MRRFSDAHGRAWEVVVGRESWGVFVALFIPVEGDDVVRTVPLTASGVEEATEDLERMEEGALQLLLERSVPNTLDD
jgi:hypothetical protein